MGPLNRRLRALERRIGDHGDFRLGAPPVDSEGLPVWDAREPLSLDGYARVLDGDIPDAELTAEERSARARLSPYRALFERLGREEAEKEGAAVK